MSFYIALSGVLHQPVQSWISLCCQVLTFLNIYYSTNLLLLNSFGFCTCQTSLRCLLVGKISNKGYSSGLVVLLPRPTPAVKGSSFWLELLLYKTFSIYVIVLLHTMHFLLQPLCRFPHYQRNVIMIFVVQFYYVSSCFPCHDILFKIFGCEDI